MSCVARIVAHEGGGQHTSFAVHVTSRKVGLLLDGAEVHLERSVAVKAPRGEVLGVENWLVLVDEGPAGLG